MIGPAGADGVFGDSTEKAVKEFQRDHNLEADGIVGPATQAALHKDYSGNTDYGDLIKMGSSGPQVAEMQRLLINAGFSVGTAGADGIFGEGTYNAVVKFQKDKGLSADGIVGPATKAALRNSSSGSIDNGELIKMGSRGPQVAEIQRLLIKAGYSVGPAGADGIFGEGTYNAVIKFQKAKGLSADGIVGPDTKRALGYVGSSNNDFNYIDGDGIRSFLDIARSQLGYHEGPNNDSKYGKWYGDNYKPWCAMFVSWCANKAGIMGRLIPRFEGCYAGVNWYKDRGRFRLSSSYTPKPGDIFFLSGYSHTGIVEKVEGNTIVTIEGNDVNDAVGRHYRSKESIWGFGANGGDITSIPSNEAIYKQQADIGFAPLLGINEIDVSKSKTMNIQTGILAISLTYSFKIEKAFENSNDNGILKRKLSIEDLKSGNIVFADGVNEVAIDFIKQGVSSIGFLLNKFGNSEIKIIFNEYPSPKKIDISLEFGTKYAGNVTAIQSVRVRMVKALEMDSGKVDVMEALKVTPKSVFCIVLVALAGALTDGTMAVPVMKLLGI
ncbi:peptidoglycan-binding protein (plasmid) [Clostridium baratii]